MACHRFIKNHVSEITLISNTARFWRCIWQNLSPLKSNEKSLSLHSHTWIQGLITSDWECGKNILMGLPMSFSCCPLPILDTAVNVIFLHLNFICAQKTSSSLLRLWSNTVLYSLFKAPLNLAPSYLFRLTIYNTPLIHYWFQLSWLAAPHPCPDWIKFSIFKLTKIPGTFWSSAYAAVLHPLLATTIPNFHSCTLDYLLSRVHLI